MSTTKLPGSAHDRLLAAANELFYAEGVHTVGIERVIERAGVAKASLYDCFGSKEELIRCYLQGRNERRQARIRERMARFQTPRNKILSVFDVLAETANISPATLSGVLLRLEVSGLVTRTRDPGDRRTVILNVTAEGKRMLKTAPSLLSNHFRERLGRMSGSEHGLLLDALVRVASLMEADTSKVNDG
jgi:AcrR family transcriptional regulator